MGCLYFIKSDKTSTLVAEGIEEEHAIYHILLFAKFKNPKYKVPYVRTWEENNGLIYYDIGSHNELFIFKPGEGGDEFLYGEDNKAQ